MKKYLLSPTSLIAALVPMTLGGVASAATLTYDADTSTIDPQDGAGLGWNLTEGNLWDGAGNVLWPNTNADEVIFGCGSGAAGNVVVGTVITNRITFDAAGSGNYTLSGGSITLDGTTPAIVVNADASIGSELAGTTGFAMSGGGKLTLTGVNSYTGGTTIGAGVLSIGSIADGGVVSSLGASSNAAANLVLAGGSLQFTGASASTDRAFTTSNDSSIEVTEAATTLAIANNIAAAGNSKILTKTGAGTLQLGGSADNTYVFLSAAAGTLELAKSANGVRAAAGIASVASGATIKLTGTGNDQIFGGSAAAGFGLNGLAGTLDLNGHSEGVSNFSGSGVVTNSATATSAVFTAGETSASTTFSGTIENGAGTVGLTKASGGTLTLIGTNTYTGVTTIGGGSLSVSSVTNAGISGPIGAASNVAGNLVFGGGSLQYTGTSASTDRSFTVTENSAIEVTQAGTSLTIANDVTANGNSAKVLNKTGAGTLVIGGSADNSNVILSATAGTLELAKTSNTVRAAAGISSIASGATVKLTGAGTDQIYGGSATAVYGVNGLAGTLDLNGHSESVSNFNGIAGGVVTNSAAATNVVWTVGETGGTGTFGGVIQNGAGSMAVTKTGGGTITLSGANTYTGLTTVLGGPGYGSGATAGLASSLILANPTGASVLGNVQLGNGGNVGAPSILKMGAANQFGASSVVDFRANGFPHQAVIKLMGYDQTVAGITSNTAAENVIENAESETTGYEAGSVNSILTINTAGTPSYTGVMRDRWTNGLGTLGITKEGTGTQTLGGANIQYTGNTLVNNGILKLVDPTGYRSAATTIASGAVVEVSNAANQISLNPSGTLNALFDGSGTFRKTGAGIMRLGHGNLHAKINLTAAGQIDIQAGTLEFGFAHNAMGANLASMHVETGAKYYTSDAAVSVDGLTGGGTIGNAFNSNLFTLTVGVSGTTDRAAFGVSGNTATFSGVIKDQETYNGVGTQNTAVVKTGSGTQVFSGANTYHGSTTINGGKLVINGSSTNSAFTVASGGTLGGSGPISGAVTVNDNGTLAPGNSVGTLNLGSVVTLESNSTYAVDITGATSHDKIVSSGTIAAGGKIKLILGGGYVPAAGATFDIADGSISGTPTFDYTSATLPSGLSWDTSEFASNGVVKVVGGGYDSWIDGYFTGVTDEAIIGADADPDHDGVNNGIEFLTGTVPNSGSSHTLPVIVRNGSGELVVTFQRHDQAESCAVVVEWSTTLQTGSWTQIAVPNDAVSSPSVTVVDNGAAPDDVTVVIPATADPRKFARVRIDIPAAP